MWYCIVGIGCFSVILVWFIFWFGLVDMLVNLGRGVGLVLFWWIVVVFFLDDLLLVFVICFGLVGSEVDFLFVCYLDCVVI